MSKVWERSQHAGSDLLMLLAIADFADDDGAAFPAVEKLARKCRMSKRNAQDRLRVLSESGELTILKNQGPPPKYPNLFMVNLGALGVRPTAPVKPAAPVQYNVERGAAHCAPGVKPTAPKPSVNHQEPSTCAHDAKKTHRSRSRSANESADDSFATFWLQYPKKVAKPQALKAWRKQKPDLATCLAALSAAKASDDWQKDKGRFIPHPATWLNGRRWEDEALQVGSQAPASVSNPIFVGAL